YKSKKHPVSPGRLIAARELLADMLLESGRPGDALAEYEASQVRDPRGSAAIGAQARPLNRPATRTKRVIISPGSLRSLGMAIRGRSWLGARVFSDEIVRPYTFTGGAVSKPHQLSRTT